MADYGEFYQLRRENKSLSDTNESLESELNTLLEQLAIPSVRNLIFAVADALIGGQPVPISSGGGGSTSDLPWDGRRPDEEEEAYRRKCLLYASRIVKHTKIRNQTLTLHFQYFSDKILRMKRQKVLFLSILRSDPAALSS